MSRMIQMAALCLSAAVFVGCDSKDNSTTTPPAPTGMSSTATTVTPMTTTSSSTTAMPDMSKGTNAVDNAINNGSNSVRNAADKMMNNQPTTAPSMPAMPK